MFLRRSLEEVKIFTPEVTSERDLTLQTSNQFQLYLHHEKRIKELKKVKLVYH